MNTKTTNNAVTIKTADNDVHLLRYLIDDLNSHREAQGMPILNRELADSPSAKVEHNGRIFASVAEFISWMQLCI